MKNSSARLSDSTIPENQDVSVSNKPSVDEVLNKNSRLNNIRFRWKGKIVKESTYKHRLALREAAVKRKLANASQFHEDPKIPVEGRRIVDLDLLAKHLKCTLCNEVLSLSNTESETRLGIASILHIRCTNCSVVHCVPTSKRITGKNSRSKLYTVNSEVVNGTMQAGMTCNRLNKLLSCLNIPQVQWKLFQRHRHEVVPAAAPDIERVEKGSSLNDAPLDIAETVQNNDAIQDTLAEFF